MMLPPSSNSASKSSGLLGLGERVSSIGKSWILLGSYGRTQLLSAVDALGGVYFSSTSPAHLSLRAPKRDCIWLQSALFFVRSLKPLLDTVK
jgi:hypothetical protein